MKGKADASGYRNAWRRVGHPRVRVQSQRGFSLVEVIVAFALLAFGLTLLLGAMTRATRQVRDAELSGRAALHAQSLLHDIGIAAPLVPGSTGGALEDGRYGWSLEVAEWQDPDPAMADGAVRIGDPGAPRLLELRLVVAWGESPRERLEVRSLRRARPPLQGTP